MVTTVPGSSDVQPLSRAQRQIVLAVAFAAWMFAGLEISTFILLTRPAIMDMLGGISTSPETAGSMWLAWYQCAFLLGAAVGGWLFGALGDRIGRSKSMALSVLCYSILTGASYFTRTPEQLLLFRFLACLGVGGVWPNAVSLVSEAWPDVSRLLLAGLLGTAANVGFVLMAVIAYVNPIMPDEWRWVFIVGALPLVIGVVALFIPESPLWLRSRGSHATTGEKPKLIEVFRQPHLKNTLMGIALGAVPVIGTAASANWITPWTDQVHDQALHARQQAGAAAGTKKKVATREQKIKAARQKALTQAYRSGGAVVGSLLGAWLAALVGRRTAYFLISLGTLAVSIYLYNYLNPLHPYFPYATVLLGFLGVTYFGWLPLYLPELFPTHVRATGSGVSFNFGRIVAAAAVAATVPLTIQYSGDYGKIGTWTSLIYAAGMVVILFAPDTSKKKVGQ